MNLLKVFCNSFFRTLARVLVYILLGIVFCFFVLNKDVHADMVSPNEISFNGTNYDSYYEIPVILDKHSLDLRVEIFDMVSRVPTLQTNLILDVCATTNQFNIWRTSAAGGSCSSSCFSQLVQVKEIPDLVCRTYTYNDNKAYRIVIPINKWSVGVGSSDYITFDDKITIYNSSVHDLYSSIYGAYYSDIGFDLNNQEALFNDLNQTQQNILNKQNEINNNINDVKNGVSDINGSINNDNVDDPSSSINSFKDKIATNGVITQLIGLPVTLFTKVLNSVNGTCSTYNLGSLFGTDLILPCVNIQNYLGTTLWSIIDVLISGLFVYSISRKFIKVFESMSSMNEGDVIGD